MSKVHQVLATGVATLGLATVLSGCGSSVIGGDGPHPGVAAQVDDTEISLSDIDLATDALCTLAEVDPTTFGSTSRSFAQLNTLQQWVKGTIAAEHAEANGLDVPPVGDLSQVLGWEDLSEEEQEALRDYAEAAQAVGAVAEDAPDPADYDVVINPRFDLRLESWADDGGFESGGERLSIQVSDQAGTGTEPPTPAEVRELPESQLCGERPPEEQPAPPIPMG